MPTVYSLESILVDVAIEVPSLPERGGDVLATASRTHAGGGFNLVAAVARQGVRSVYAAPYGGGRYGDVIRAALATEGVAWTAAPRTGDSGFTVALVEPDGERTFVTMAGVEAAVTDDDLAAITPLPGDAVVVSGYDLAYPGSGPVLAGWLTGLPDGVLVTLDPGPLVAEIPPERLRRVLPRLDILTLNQREARLLSGAASAGADLLAAVRPLVPAALTIVREGADGCVASGGPLGDRVVAVPAPVVPAVDTTGAGDAHTGVLLAGLVTGHPVDDVLVDAVHAAAVSVRHVGSATCPTRAELDAAYPERHRVRT
ncbi:PfkB family carbohydrate kinase [Cryptosporangium aurantiacum]|uniref:Sugar or nucleoside kinase, ribokinase family n=1 Tax=Cryptosporangium aurantiacum TaxID=134849 RepID=A0A1M7RIP5_9ACTN|nr:PfkB family carbohydrate kinase [Cryptosporangium aurantiacum]SHN46195.1 Sugar or nucleoside kinase, ribokinase family [Cryptosporangium aurantiacum]